MSKCAREDQNCSCLNRVYGKDYVPKVQNHRERTKTTKHSPNGLCYLHVLKYWPSFKQKI